MSFETCDALARRRFFALQALGFTVLSCNSVRKPFTTADTEVSRSAALIRARR
jgi:hypothetical protein